MNDNVKNALVAIDNATQRGALTYISREDCMAVTPLFKPEVTLITLRLPKERNDPDADVYEISGKYMPKREVVDRIGEASGLTFIGENCRTWTETRDDDIAGKRTAYISEQVGKRRMSDGSWRTSSVQQYEFDPVMRAMIDYDVTELTPETKQKKDRWGKKTLAMTILEYTKVARQRAETGARLRVIRELTNMPTAFSKTDAQRPLLFGRFAQNTDYILQTPEGRAMASAQVLGIDPAALFGGRKLPAEQAESNPPAQETAAALPESAEQYDAASATYDEAPDEYENHSQGQTADTTTLAEQALGNEFDALTTELERMCADYKSVLDTTLKSGMNPYAMAQAELDQNNFNATVETRHAMVKRVKDFLAAKGVAA